MLDEIKAEQLKTPDTNSTSPVLNTQPAKAEQVSTTHQPNKRHRFVQIISVILTVIIILLLLAFLLQKFFPHLPIQSSSTKVMDSFSSTGQDLYKGVVEKFVVNPSTSQSPTNQSTPVITNNSITQVNSLNNGITQLVENTVNQYVQAPVSSQTIPGSQGPAGPQGPEGPQGLQGPRGENGVTTLVVSNGGGSSGQSQTPWLSDIDGAGYALQNTSGVNGLVITPNTGVITTGTWNGTAIGILYGGTGATTSQAAINNLSQLTTAGDLLYYDGTNSTRLARGSNGQCLTSDTTTILWSSCSGLAGTTALSDLTPASALNTIDNANYAQEWDWNSLTTEDALVLSSNSISSGDLLGIYINSTAATSNAQTALNILTQGANSNASQTTYGISVDNSHTGTGSANVAGYFTASGGDSNYAGIFDQGNVGIGTLTPTSKLAVSAPSSNIAGELVTNGGFNTDASGWTLTSCVTWSSGHLVSAYVNFATCGTITASTSYPVVAGHTYKVTFDISSATKDGGFVYFNIGATNWHNEGPYWNGHHTLTYVADTTGTETIFFDHYYYEDNSSFNLDNVSVQEISAVIQGVAITGYDGSKWLNLGGDTQDNIGIGLGSLAAQNYQTVRNTAYGSHTLGNNTRGWFNVAVGAYALFNNVNGNNNTALGDGALFNNVDGYSNVAIGSDALAGNTSGHANVGIGYSALRDNTTGINNIAIGQYALQTNTTGGSNISVGGLGTNTTGSNNVGVGGLGNSTTGSNNTAVGISSLGGNGSYNTALGYLALSGGGGSGTGSYNVGVGYNTMSNFTFTGQQNTALGTFALANMTSGSTNVGIGYSAMQNNNSGANNIAIGYNAGLGANSGPVGIGTFASNVFIGASAGSFVESGSNNVIIGDHAAQNLSTGSSNIVIGYMSGLATVTTGSSNIYIGNNIAPNDSTANNVLDIGNLIFSNGIDGTNTTISTGSIGIANRSPSALLTLGTAGSRAGTLSLAGSTSGTITIQPQAAAGTYNFNLPTTAGTSGFILTSGGGGATAMTWTDPATLTGGSALNAITAATVDDTDNDSTNKQISWNWSTPITQNAFTLNNSGTGLTSGSIFRVTSSTTGAVSSGIVQFTASGAYTSTGGLLNVTANSTTAGVVANFNGTSVTTGQIMNIGAGAGITSGAALKVTASGTSAISSGLVQISHSGAYTSTGGLLNVASTASTAGTLVNFTNNTASFTGTLQSISLTGQTSGTGLAISGGGANLTSSGKLLDLSLGAATAGVGLNISSTGVYTGAGLIQVAANSATTGTLASISSSSLSSGKLLDLTITGTAATTNQKAINVSTSGVVTGAQTTYGGFFGNTHTGATAINVGLYSTASGATGANYAAIFDQGNVGIGDISPTAMLTVGNGDLFQVNSSGAIAAVVGITSSGNYVQSTGNLALTTNVSTGTDTSSGLSVAASAITSGTLLNLNQDTTTFTGTGIKANFANASGTFTGNFADFQVNGASKFTIKSGTTTASGATAVAGLLQDVTLTNGTASGAEYGNRLQVTVNGGTAGSNIGQLIKITDNTVLDAGQTVRGLEVQAFAGSNVNGINTGIAGFGYTFGVQGTTTSQGAAQTTPAAVFADLDNGTDATTKTRGNAIRAYTNDATSATLVQFYQETSAYTGTGLLMDFGNSAGSFTGNFVNYKVNGTSRYSIDSSGDVIIADNDFGNGAAGPFITLGRNTNATNTGAGSINFQSKAGTAGYVWQDNAGNLRINTAAPSNANDAAGTVVGTQTSTRDTKQDITDYTDIGAALQMVTSAPLHTFRYIKDVQGYGTDSPLAKTRLGFIADEVPGIFMWGNSIDQVSINGLLIGSVQALKQKIDNVSAALPLAQPNYADAPLVIKAHLYLSGDSIGQAKILAGSKKVHITFAQPYQFLPITTATPIDFVNSAYRITDIDNSGFSIELRIVETSDVTFNWHTFAGEEAKLTVSDGTIGDLVISSIADQSNNAIQTTNSAQATSSSAGDQPQVLDDQTTIPSTDTVSTSPTSSDEQIAPTSVPAPLAPETTTESSTPPISESLPTQ